MPEEPSPLSVHVKRKISDSTERRELIQLPTDWSAFQFEYIGPVIWIPPSSVWTLDFSLANRGVSDESFFIILTEFHFAPDQPSDVHPVTIARAGRVFLVNWVIERLAASGDEQGWWPRIVTTSRNVIPSVRIYGESLQDVLAGSVRQSFPEFYLSPGDFALFELTGRVVPPIGPLERARPTAG